MKKEIQYGNEKPLPFKKPKWVVGTYVGIMRPGHSNYAQVKIEKSFTNRFGDWRYVFDKSVSTDEEGFGEEDLYDLV